MVIMVCKNVLISIPKELLEELDKEREKPEFKPNRSQFICKCIDSYLKVHRGIPYMIKRIKPLQK